MDKETLSYKTRQSGRTYCIHCSADTEHYACLDPNLKAWIEICKKCEMVELADDELEKLGTTYAKRNKKEKK